MNNNEKQPKVTVDYIKKVLGTSSTGTVKNPSNNRATYDLLNKVTNTVPALKENKDSSVNIVPALQVNSTYDSMKNVSNSSNTVPTLQYGTPQYINADAKDITSKAGKTIRDGINYKGDTFLGEQELARRGNEINSANNTIPFLQVASNVFGKFGSNPISNYFDNKIAEQQEKIDSAKDLSKYSDQQIKDAYENADNYNFFERLFDSDKKGVYTMKQQITPTYNDVVRKDVYSKLLSDGNYQDFVDRFVDYTEAGKKAIEEKYHGSGSTDFIEAMQNGWALKNGYSIDELKVLADYLVKNNQMQEAEEFANEHPVLSSAFSVVTNPLGHLEGSIYGLSSEITGKPIDSESSHYTLQDYTGEIRNTVSEGIDNNVGKFVYGAGMSMADSLAAMVIGGGNPAITSAIMATGAYSETAQEGAERGLTPSQIQTTAIASGAFEYLFEKISWDKLSLIAKGEASKNILVNIATQAFTEGAEEVGTDFANMLVDNLVNGGASEMVKLHDFYMEYGMTDSEAQAEVMKQMAKQLGLSFAGGALSGGVMGGGASAYNHITGNVNNNTNNQNDNINEDTVNLASQIETQMNEQGNGRNRLSLDTMYIKNSHPTMPDANSPRALRPKRSVGKATFDNSVSNSSENVNVHPRNTESPNNVNVSRTRTNTMMNSGTTTEQEANQYMPESDFTYESVSEKESMQRAESIVNEGGVDNILKKASPLEGYEIDALMIEYSSLMKNARETNNTYFYERANRVFKKIQTESTRNAQSLQALAKWSRNTPEGQLAEAQHSIMAEAEKRIGKKNIENAENKTDLLLDKAEKVNESKSATYFSEKTYDEALEDLKNVCKDIDTDWQKIFDDIISEAENIDRNGVIDILTKYGKINKAVSEIIKDDTETQAAVLDYLYTIQNENLDLNSRRAKTLMAKAGKLLANKIPSSFGGRLKQKLFNNMLESFRTIISRNAGGNIGLAIAEQLRQPIAATVDRIVSKKTGYRTTTGWSARKQSAYVKGMLKGISDEFQDLRSSFDEYKRGEISGLHTSRTGENTLKNAIELNKTAFNGNYGDAISGKLLNAKKGLLNKIFNLKNDYIKHGMSFGDRVFYESSYAQAKAEIGILIQNNCKVNVNDLDLDEYIDVAANLIALEAVFQNDTELSKGFSDLKNNLAKICEGIVGVDIITQASVPFVKTPSNIVDMAIQYSPFGAIRNTVNTVKEFNNGSFNQRRFSDETSRNIMGFLLLFGSIALLSNGITSGSYDDDKDVKQAQKQAGMQEYALKLGDKYVDVGYIPVLGQIIEEGAAFGSAFTNSQNEGKGFIPSLFDGLVSASSQTVDSVFEQSMLSGLSELLGTSSYSDDDSFMTRAGKSALNILGQFIPANIRQIANSIDDKQRYTGQYGTSEYTANNLISQVPFLRETLNEKYDNAGNVMLTNDGRGIGQRLFENMVLPGKVTEINETQLYNEARRLYEQTGDNGAFLPTASINDISTGYFTPTSDDFTEYQKILGTMNSSIADALINSDYYKSINDSSRVSAFESAYAICKQVAKAEIIPDFTVADSYKVPYSIYEEKGIDGIVNFIDIKNTAKNLDPDSKSVSDWQWISAILDCDMSVSDKGLYLSKIVTLSKGAENVLNSGGYESLATFYSIRTDAYNINPENDKATNAEYIEALQKRNIPDNEKGYYLSQLINLSQAAQEAFQNSGYAGVYQYYSEKVAAEKEKESSSGKITQEYIHNVLTGNSNSNTGKITQEYIHNVLTGSKPKITLEYIHNVLNGSN